MRPKTQLGPNDCAPRRCGSLHADLDPEADAFGEGPALVDSDGERGGAPVGAR